jgi:thiamine-phosphate pyrophosphorylase
MSMHTEAPLLYLISPPQITDLGAFEDALAAALDAGQVGAFQLRLKQTGADAHAPGRLTLPSAADELILRTCERLIPICRGAEVAFILNDRVDLVRPSGADGVHLGQEDGSIALARAALGDEFVIGATCHASRHLAMEAGEQGADYVAFGAFYPTTSKSPEALAHWGVPTPEILQWCSDLCELPCVAIGGINPLNCAPLLEAGADFLAVLSYVWDHPQGSAAAVREFHPYLVG